MAGKASTIVGLDIGTTNTTVVVADVQRDAGSAPKINVVGVGTSPSRGLRKGVVINIEATVSAISAAVSEAESMSGREIKSVYASVSGSHIQGFNSHGIVAIRSREVSQYDIDKVMEAAKAVAIPLDREVLHVLPQEFIIDEQDGIKEPIGISGVRLEARVHLVSGSIASAQNIIKCANRCGLNVRGIVLASLASAKAVLSPEEQELGVCLVDIGGGTTDITVFQGGGVRYTSVISVGGTHITNDIAAGLRTPVIAAEEIKCGFGTTLKSLVSKDETIEVPSTGGRPARVLSKQVLSEIIEPRVTEIFTLVHRELVKSGCDEYLTSGLVLTGGSAGLKGVVQVAEQIFNLPVRVGTTCGVSGLADLVAPPEYATAVGLVVSGAGDAAARSFSLGFGAIGRMFKKAGNWFAEHF
ncbi:MAG: cell division protein FtsA [Deltaproteobacteria bacterium]|nr:cell division protein FtsA [Deltaproteobacteria bacterium]